MASFKSHPFYSSLLAVCGVAAVAGAYLIVPLPLPFNLYRERSTALAKLAATQEDYKKFQNKNTTPVTPNPENQKAIEADLKQTTEVLAATRDALTGKGGLAEKNRAEPVPADSAAAFFKIGLFRKEKFEKFHSATLDSPAEEKAVSAGKDDDETAKAPPAPKTIKNLGWCQMVALRGNLENGTLHHRQATNKTEFVMKD